MAKERPFEGGWLSREAIIIIMKILGTTLGTNNKVYTYSPNQPKGGLGGSAASAVTCCVGSY